MTGLAESVAGASGKQTKTIQEIHSAVRAMNQVTQGSGANAEESAAAAEELNPQACSMKSAVSELLSLIGGARKLGKASQTDVSDRLKTRAVSADRHLAYGVCFKAGRNWLLPGAHDRPRPN
jgi:hypothetical protein